MKYWLLSIASLLGVIAAEGTAEGRDLQSTLLLTGLATEFFDIENCTVFVNSLELITEEVEQQEQLQAVNFSLSTSIVVVEENPMEPCIQAGLNLATTLDFTLFSPSFGFIVPNALTVPSFEDCVSSGMSNSEIFLNGICAGLTDLLADAADIVGDNAFLDMFPGRRPPQAAVEQVPVAEAAAQQLLDVVLQLEGFDPVDPEAFDGTLDTLMLSGSIAPVVLGFQENLEPIQAAIEATIADPIQGGLLLPNVIIVNIPNLFELATGLSFDEEVVPRQTLQNVVGALAGFFLSGQIQEPSIDGLTDQIRNVILAATGEMELDVETQAVVDGLAQALFGILTADDPLVALENSIGPLVTQLTGDMELGSDVASATAALLDFIDDQDVFAFLEAIVALGDDMMVTGLLTNLINFAEAATLSGDPLGFIGNNTATVAALLQISEGEVFELLILINQAMVDPSVLLQNLDVVFGVLGAVFSLFSDMGGMMQMGGMSDDLSLFTVGGIFQLLNLFQFEFFQSFVQVVPADTPIGDALDAFLEANLLQTVNVFQNNEIAFTILGSVAAVAGSVLGPGTPTATVEVGVGIVLNALEQAFPDSSLTNIKFDLSRILSGPLSALVDFDGVTVQMGTLVIDDPTGRGVGSDLVISDFTFESITTFGDFERVSSTFLLPQVSVSVPEAVATFHILGQEVNFTSSFTLDGTQGISLFLNNAQLAAFGFGSWTDIPAGVQVFSDLAACGLSSVAASFIVQDFVSNFQFNLDLGVSDVSPDLALSFDATDGAVEELIDFLSPLYAPLLPTAVELTPLALPQQFPVLFLEDGLAACAANPFVEPPVDDGDDDGNDDGDGDGDDNAGDDDDDLFADVPLEILVPAVIGAIVLAAAIGFLVFSSGAAAATAGVAAGGAAAGGAAAAGGSAAADEKAAEMAAKAV